ncbi:hypothetical protein PIIN_01386 [Serendipita indica DSM 11827]|uniref:Extracellular membrane protein CFEM domain-containing protein n=1 Tax=Serendipita indica (strain DSM 11827) TaxID=1109443 RepID=G4T8B4_SERID|nr:hypothetical protein PIIN_01386 [Serendipita indica DSM 11827]
MFIARLAVVAVSFSSALAFAVEERAPTVDPALEPLGNVPSACTSQCAILQTLAAIDPSNLSTLSPACTSQAQSDFLKCITCFEANSPSTFTPELLTAMQTSADNLNTGCLLVGSPVSSLAIPTPTGGAASGNSAATGSNAATTSPASSGSSPNGAQTIGATWGAAVGLVAAVVGSWLL